MKQWLLLILLSLIFSCYDKNLYIEKIAINDIPLPETKEGDWLSMHKEGQNFNAYVKSNPICKDSIHKNIFLIPLGSFDATEMQLLQKTKEYVALYFQMNTILLAPITDTTIPSFARRQRGNQWEQLLSSYILDSILIKIKPDSALMFMAFSKKDLYPKDDWNFVFGQARLKQRVGISSIYRLQNEQAAEQQNNFTKTLIRLCKVSSHELGHMLSQNIVLMRNV